ncbi:MAG: hypothetical protein MUP76_05140 [Acidimicrobiia bacterium]|nr:hypothetical protein [Acidimicrobiia bacterium]
MPVSVVIATIAEERLEDWRAFHGELVGARRGEWAESQRRRGITREAILFWSSPSGPAALYVVEGTEAGAAMGALGESDDPFDVWLRERLADLHDDLDFPVALSDTRPPAGSWRGWRGLRSRGFDT